MDKYKNMTCLIADDFSTARRIIKNSLQELGFICLEAENGEQALEIIEQTTINLLIADIHMPDKSGLELLEDIRTDDILKDIPVILTMIEPLNHIIKEGEELGMTDYLVKPFDVFMLSKVLDKVIETELGESL
jgi:two-component system chemotaxis response regulator CheY